MPRHVQTYPDMPYHAPDMLEPDVEHVVTRRYSNNSCSPKLLKNGSNDFLAFWHEVRGPKVREIVLAAFSKKVRNFFL